MAVHSVRIKEFPKDGKPWRVDGVDRMSYPGTAITETRVDVHLSELHADFTDALLSRAITGRGMVVNVRVGQITVIPPGSVWINGVRMPHKKSPSLAKFTASASQFELRSFTSLIEIDGEQKVMLPRDRYRFSPESWKGLANSWVLVIRNPKPNIEYMVIPCGVVFQRCAATSPNAVRRLVMGQLDKIVDSNYWFSDPVNPNIYFVEVFKYIRTLEAKSHANLLADDVGQTEYAQFRNNIVISSVNTDHGKGVKRLPAYIKFGFPFSNPMELTVEGKFFHVGAKSKDQQLWGMFVTQITSLSTKLVFDALIARRKNDNRKGANSTDPNLNENAWPTAAASTIDFEQDVPLHSDDDPALDLTKESKEEAGGFTAVGLKIIDSPKVTQKYRNKKDWIESMNADGRLTTGDPRNYGRGGHALDVVALEVPPVPLALSDFFKTLSFMNKAGHVIKTIAVTTSTRQDDDGNVTNFFPRMIKGLRSWHLESDDPMASPRGYVVAEIKVGSVWHYFIELQRKAALTHSLAFIHAVDGTRIEPKHIQSYMFEVARDNGWPKAAKFPQWVFRRKNHTQGNDAELFSAALINMLSS